MNNFRVSYCNYKPPYNELYIPPKNLQAALNTIETYKEQTEKYFKENSLLQTEISMGFMKDTLENCDLGDLKYALMNADAKIKDVVIKRLDWLSKEIKDLSSSLEHINLSDDMKAKLNNNVTDFINGELSSGPIKEAFTTQNDIRTGPIRDFLDSSSSCCIGYEQIRLYGDRVKGMTNRLERSLTEKNGITMGVKDVAFQSIIKGGPELSNAVEKLQKEIAFKNEELKVLKILEAQQKCNQSIQFNGKERDSRFVESKDYR